MELNSMKLKARNIFFSLIHPDTNIYSYRNTNYSDYIYFPIEKLQSINKVNMSNAEEIFSFYMEWDRYVEYYPDPAFDYTKLLDEITAINGIIMYKVLCRERLFSDSCINWKHKQFVSESIDKLISEVSRNPYISYFELLDLFPDDEIELVIESLIEDNRLQHTKISKGNKKGKSIITIK